MSNQIDKSVACGATNIQRKLTITTCIYFHLFNKLKRFNNYIRNESNKVLWLYIMSVFFVVFRPFSVLLSYSIDVGIDTKNDNYTFIFYIIVVVDLP